MDVEHDGDFPDITITFPSFSERGMFQCVWRPKTNFSLVELQYTVTFSVMGVEINFHIYPHSRYTQT